MRQHASARLRAEQDKSDKSVAQKVAVAHTEDSSRQEGHKDLDGREGHNILVEARLDMGGQGVVLDMDDLVEARLDIGGQVVAVRPDMGG